MTFRYLETKADDAYTVLDAMRGDGSQVYITKFAKPEHLIYMEIGSGDDRASLWFTVEEFDLLVAKITHLNEKFKTET